MTNPTLIIVTGMHRAGTSAMTGCLEAAGVHLGSNLAKGQSGINDLGYKEDLDIIDIHEDLLWSLPSCWDDIRPTQLESLNDEYLEQIAARVDKLLTQYFQTSSLCAIKDPRLCLFLPLWTAACSRLNINPIILIPTRKPSAVAKSLHTRDGINTERAYLLWIKYFLYAEYYSRGHKRVFSRYEKLLSKPESTLRAVFEPLDLVHKNRINLEAGLEFISPTLNRSAEGRLCEPSTWVADCAETLYEVMGEPGINDEFSLVFDSVFSRYKEYLLNSDPILLDQSRSLLNHGAEFRRFWIDAKNSRLLRLSRKLRGR